MVWFKVDDGFAFHHKAAAAGNRAVGLWARAGAFSSAQLTEGFVPVHMIGALGGNTSDADKLVTSGLWEADGSGGWRFHAWDEYQPSREEVEEDRRRSRERQRKWRENRRANGVTDTVSDDVSNGVTDTVTNGSPTRPDPTRPEVLVFGPVDPPPPETLRAREKAEGGPTGNGNNGEPTALGQLIDQVQAIRPGWARQAIHNAITAASREHRWLAIGPALIELARLPDTNSPGRLTHDGPWWKTSTGPPPPPGVDERAIDEATRLAEQEQADQARQRGRTDQLDAMGEAGRLLRLEAAADLRDRGMPTPRPLVDRRAIELLDQEDAQR